MHRDLWSADFVNFQVLLQHRFAKSSIFHKGKLKKIWTDASGVKYWFPQEMGGYLHTAATREEEDVV